MKESITSQKLGCRDFWRIANSVLNKGKSAIPPLFNDLEVLSSTSDEAKFFAGNFSKNSNLDDSGISNILAELFNRCLRESCFRDWFHQWSLYLRMLQKGLELKATAL